MIELSYTMTEDSILYPNISFETENLAELGMYGLMAMNYLKDNYHERYMSLERTGRLIDVLKPVNEEAHQMVDRMMEKYMKKESKVSELHTSVQKQIFYEQKHGDASRRANA